MLYVMLIKLCYNFLDQLAVEYQMLCEPNNATITELYYINSPLSFTFFELRWQYDAKRWTRRTVVSFEENYQDILAVEGEPTSFAEHKIKTSDHVPISVPTYTMTPANKEKLEYELFKLLQDG